MLNNYYAVIMAGGGGTRLWPLSRSARPKQFIRLQGDKSLFQTAVERLNGFFSPDHIYIVTVADQAVELKRQAPQIPDENYLIEPKPRGTASVVGLAAVAIRQRDPQGVMAVLTSDHFIKNVRLFHNLLQSGYQLASEGFLVTLGIRPTYPGTGYGYIQRGERLGDYDDIPAYGVARFKEKPDELTARTFLEMGDHDWNSGMFIWSVDRIWREMTRLMPDLASRLREIEADWQTENKQSTLLSAWEKITPQTIDYGIMEKASRVVVLHAENLGWNDVGTWESLFEVFSADDYGNIVLQSQHVDLDTKNTLVCSEGSDRLIVTVGVENMVIVDTGDTILVCSREQSQKIKEVVNLLKLSGKTNYL
jgi:mannose-1-phosphate guanylyltransferase